MPLKEGSKAPDFSLFDTEKKKVNLNDYSGKNVLILFFPLAFTNVCTSELCQLRDEFQDFANLNTNILGISVDSLFTLGRYKQENNLPFPLLSDFNKEVSEAYGSLYETFGFEMKGVSKRSAFLVDNHQIIRYAEVLENASQLPDFEKIKLSLGLIQ